ncbi:hypothetical protein CYY_007315 [Polysphondylium violaceum]|uniref:Uncharacterized protein n=1 Tax=Polysphondylium violaceum TaxID=133409 RepID=A0A8J4PR56_9MYCE|nr:hypothetical protein CYY_007315 [Polysphondylium violaceum]
MSLSYKYINPITSRARKILAKYYSTLKSPANQLQRDSSMKNSMSNGIVLNSSFLNLNNSQDLNENIDENIGEKKNSNNDNNDGDIDSTSEIQENNTVLEFSIPRDKNSIDELIYLLKSFKMNGDMNIQQLVYSKLIKKS